MGKVWVTFRQKQRGIWITKLMARDGALCCLCDQPLDRHIKNGNHPMYITFDHVLPFSKGGSDELKNLRLAHQICNNLRGNSDAERERGDGDEEAREVGNSGAQSEGAPSSSSSPEQDEPTEASLRRESF